MKVLLVSNLVLDRTSNMGKTFLSYFDAFSPDEIAQFYIYSEVPTDDGTCRRYYRFTDRDAVRSIFCRKTQGTIFGSDDIDRTRTDPRVDTGIQTKIYRAGSKKTPFIHMMRNFVWKMSRWKSEKLLDWIRDFGPDAVFFASGDSLFMYNIAREISETFHIPLIISAVDDFYVYNRHQGQMFGTSYFKTFMKTVRKTMDAASCVLPICDSMGEQYQKMFGIPCYTLHTPVERKKVALRPDASQISYIGNVDFGRYLQLVDIGRSLREQNGNGLPDMLDVYSQERNPAFLELLTEENGIRFHGAISAEEVVQTMEKSLAVVHTESFDPKTREIVRYSVSTKIAESLMYGPCLLAYGPEGIESIDYLRRNDAAFVITDKKDLPAGLRSVCANAAERERILKNARLLAETNHDIKRTGRQVRDWIGQCIEDAKKADNR